MITNYEVKTWMKAGMRQTPKSNALAALALRVDSQLTAGQSERVAWLGNVGPLKAHDGELKPGKPIENNFQIRNEKFSQAIAIPGEWARLDKTGDARRRIGQLTQRYVQWPGKLVAQLIESGFSANGYDNVSFFNASHVIGKGSFSNLITSDIATPAAPTADEAAKSVGKAIAALWGFPDDQGEPFNEDMSAVTIVCHSDWADVFTAALQAPNLDTGAGVRTNSLQFIDVQRTLIASPRFTGLKGSNRFCVFRSDAQAAPFIFQENKTEARDILLGEGSDHYAKQDEYFAAIYATGNGGFGNPQDAIAVTMV